MVVTAFRAVEHWSIYVVELWRAWVVELRWTWTIGQWRALTVQQRWTWTMEQWQAGQVCGAVEGQALHLLELDVTWLTTGETSAISLPVFLYSGPFNHSCHIEMDNRPVEYQTPVSGNAALFPRRNALPSASARRNRPSASCTADSVPASSHSPPAQYCKNTAQILLVFAKSRAQSTGYTFLIVGIHVLNCFCTSDLPF